MQATGGVGGTPATGGVGGTQAVGGVGGTQAVGGVGGTPAAGGVGGTQAVGGVGGTQAAGGVGGMQAGGGTGGTQATDAGGEGGAVEAGNQSDCAGIAGRQFGSVTPMECGAFSNGTIIYCTWVVAFYATGSYRWDHSDTGSVYGSYRCNGSMITVEPDRGSTMIAQYDAPSDRLTWYGAVYAPYKRRSNRR